MQYLAHLKQHKMALPPSANKCKCCLLIFLEPDQLTFHVRTDHVSMYANSMARPFTFTVMKSPAVRRAPSPVLKNASAGAGTSTSAVASTSFNVSVDLPVSVLRPLTAKSATKPHGVNKFQVLTSSVYHRFTVCVLCFN